MPNKEVLNVSPQKTIKNPYSMKQFKKLIPVIAAFLFAVPVLGQTAGAGVVAEDITMPPIEQAAPILPFVATASGSAISSYTLETIPSSTEGVLNINMNGNLVPMSEGMMLTPDLVNSLSFTPDPTFTGDVVFTYSATDENGFSSNIANYTIPVVGAQAIILPINLLSFTGNLDNRKARLFWETAQENNSSYFEIQRSTDGNTFETIATTTAKGNCATVSRYQENDDLYFYHLKKVYYRLKMVSVDGSYTFSKTVALQLDAETKSAVKAWPLPFVNNLTISYNSAATETVKICVRSVNGAIVSSSSSSVKQGNNIIYFNQAQSIPAGTYLLTISNGSTSETIKVIKN